MLKQMRKMKEADGGFTLIELLLVIVILGILAAVVVFSVSGITDRGATSACAASKSSIQTGAEAMFAKGGKYPTSTADLKAAGFLSELNGAGVGSPVETFTASNAAWHLVITYAAAGDKAPTFAAVGTGATDSSC